VALLRWSKVVYVVFDETDTVDILVLQLGIPFVGIAHLAFGYSRIFGIGVFTGLLGCLADGIWMYRYHVLA
jgi:hypothetical protein